MHANLKNHFEGHGITGWNAECDKAIYGITMNVWNGFPEGGEGKDTDLSK